jgi:hypothetical protein
MKKGVIIANPRIITIDVEIVPAFTIFRCTPPWTHVMMD